MILSDMRELHRASLSEDASKYVWFLWMGGSLLWLLAVGRWNV